MLSKNQIKYFRSLQQKKFRDQYGIYIVEGVKLLEELIGSGKQMLDVLFSSVDLPFELPETSLQISEKDLKAISALSTPNKVFVTVKQENTEEAKVAPAGVRLALDGVSDPGNLGTILRIADWFGINEVILGEGCVELYNPKVVQASMGSIFRMKVSKAALPYFLREAGKQQPVFGASLKGNSLYEETFPQDFILLMGSESHGISGEIENLLTREISIPRFGSGESLNVAMATAIICSEIKRGQ